MKFFIFPNYHSHYDIRMVNGLGSSLSNLGHHVKVFNHPVSEIILEILVKQENPDIVIQINKFRPDNVKKYNFRHISWFQDVFPSTNNNSPKNFNDKDIVYTLGSKESLGLTQLTNVRSDCLVTGVDPIIIDKNFNKDNFALDVSLCGFMPTIPEVNTKRSAYIRWTIASIIRKLPVIRSISIIKLLLNIIGSTFPKQLLADMMIIVEANYDQLNGNLNIDLLSKKLNLIANNYCYYVKENKKPNSLFTVFNTVSEGKNIYSSNLAVENLIDWCSREYPRYLDRYKIIQKIQELDIVFKVYGKGWKDKPELNNIYGGELSSLSELCSVYKNTLINVSNNTHGLGLHSRVLECMAVGGFIITHPSQNDLSQGGILTEFENNKHFIFYTEDNLQECIMYWLKNNKMRNEIAENAKAIIKKNHLWNNRAIKINNDLSA